MGGQAIAPRKLKLKNYTAFALGGAPLLQYAPYLQEGIQVS
jgi:hypothetical protein